MRGAVFSALAVMFLASPVAAQTQLTLLAEDNYPSNFMRDGKLTGLSVDLLTEAFRRSGVPQTMTVLPWARAYDAALKTRDTCVFSAAHTAERDTSFKWVQPLNTIEMIVVADPGHPVQVKDTDDLRRYTIGTYVGDYREAVLKGMGMHIESVSVDALNADKLRRGRIDLWATDNASLLKLKGEFTPVYTYYKVDLALACNASTDSGLIARLQTALDGMREDGTVTRMRQVYDLQ